MQNRLETIIGDGWRRTKIKVSISSINLLDLLVLQVYQIHRDAINLFI
jgi:hypothetical protein